MKINVLADLFHCSEVNSFDKKLLALHTDQFHSPNFKYGLMGSSFLCIIVKYIVSMRKHFHWTRKFQQPNFIPSVSMQ